MKSHRPSQRRASLIAACIPAWYSAAVGTEFDPAWFQALGPKSK